MIRWACAPYEKGIIIDWCIALHNQQTPPSFIVVIPARLDSKRLPGKLLADINGKPMLVHVAERARAAGAERILIATDSHRIVDAVCAYGFEAILTRLNHASGTDRLAEVVNHFGWHDNTLVVNVQGDEPLIHSSLISEVAFHLAKCNDCAIASAAYPMIDGTEVFDPNIVKVVLDARARALYFSRAPIPWVRDIYSYSNIHASPASGYPIYCHIGIYAYRVHFLRHFSQLSRAPIEEAEALEQLRALWHGERIAVFVTDKAPLIGGVDTSADLTRARAIFASYNA